MESEITLKGISWKEGQGDKGPWRKLTLEDTKNVQYSAFSNQIPPDAMEVVNKLKAGDLLKIEYDSTQWKGKTIFNLKGIVDYAPGNGEGAKVPPVAREGGATHEGGSRTSSIVAQAIIKSQLFAVVVDTMYKANDGMDPDMDLILEAARKKMVTLYKELKAEVGE